MNFITIELRLRSLVTVMHFSLANTSFSITSDDRDIAESTSGILPNFHGASTRRIFYASEIHVIALVPRFYHFAMPCLLNQS